MKRETSLYGQVVVLPFRVGAPMTEALEWKTDLITAHDGSENAIKVRGAPRQSFEMTVPVSEYSALAFNMLHGSIGLPWAVPVWTERQVVSVQAGAQEVEAELSYSDFRDDSLAILWRSPEDFELIEIERTGSGVLDVHGFVLASYTDAYLMPVRVGRITPVSGRQVSPRHTHITLHFESDDNAQLEVTAPAQYQGYDLFTECPKFAGIGLDDQIHTRADIVDQELGVVSQFTPWALNRRTRMLRTVARGAADIWEYREWLHRRSGKYRPFWWPTFEHDLVLQSTGSLTDQINVIDEGFSEHSSRSHIAVILNDGTVLPREIISASPESDGEVDLLLDSSLSINASQVSKVSYLGLMRLDTDRVEMLHQGRDLLVSEVNAVEISS